MANALNQIKLGDKHIAWKSPDTLLDALERAKVDIASSCRAGACHSCLVKCAEGMAPAEAQVGLKTAWKEQGLFLACLCQTPQDMVVELPGSGVSQVARLVGKQSLGPDVVQLQFKVEGNFEFRPGQFLSLIRQDGLTRSYSIASIPEDGYVELHVRVVEQGQMSQYLQLNSQVGEAFQFRGPHGDCFYIEGKPDQPILLMGTGTGLAPLVGIARDALQKGHRAPIYLFHGGRSQSDLYFHEELKAIAKAHSHVFYIPSLSSEADHQRLPMDEKKIIRQGRLNPVVEKEIANLKGFRVFLCGSPPMVKDAKQFVYKAGVELDDIYADAFISSPAPTSQSLLQPRQGALVHSLAQPSSLTETSSKRSDKNQVGSPTANSAPKTWKTKVQSLRFMIQALTLAGFLTQGVLFYQTSFRPMGNLLPFMAYDSLGHRVLSSTLILWAILFALIAMFGRFACGWLCPFGFIQDAGQKFFALFKITLPKPKQQPRLARMLMAALVLSHFVLLPLLSIPNPVWQFDWFFREPWLLGFPFRVSLFVLDLIAIFITLGLILPYFMGPRPYCKMVCETGYLMGLAAKWSFGKIRRNEGFERDTCLSCLKCTQICPQGIQVHEEVHLFDRVVNDNCITCLQCVGTCPNQTIVYSLRKKVANTGRVAGYLATLGTQSIDLPRFALTTMGVAFGGWLGFTILPPSYLHTYLLFASFGGLLGYGLWRLLGLFLGERFRSFQSEDVLTQVEKENKERLLPLSASERLTATSKRKKMPVTTVASLAILILITALTMVWLISHTPKRIVEIESIPKPLTMAGMVSTPTSPYLGVAQIGSSDETYHTFANFASILNQRRPVNSNQNIILFTGPTYGSVASALVEGRIQAAILPAATAYTTLRRHPNTISAAGQFSLNGATTYAGMLIAAPDFSWNEKQLSHAKIAFTSLESLSGYLRPMAWLQSQGISLADFDQVVLAGNHSHALALLHSHQVDLVATFDAALGKALKPSEYKLIARFEGLPQDILLVRRDWNASGLIQSLQRFQEDSTLKDYKWQFAKGSGFDGFQTGVESSLDSLEPWLQ